MTSPEEMTSSEENVYSSLESTIENEFSGVPPIDISGMDSASRTLYSGASSSEVFPMFSTKQHDKRPQSTRTCPPKSPCPLLAMSSSIPLPVKNSGRMKIPLLLKNTSKTLSMRRINTVSDKHTLEVKFINTNKRYLQLKKELIDKQKPVIDLYRSLLETKKKLEEVGKLVTLEDIKLVPYTKYNEISKFDGGGEEVALEVLHKMRRSVEEIPKRLSEICQDLLKKRVQIVELLNKIAKSEIDVGDVAGRMESLQNEGQWLQESLEEVLKENKRKIKNLITNWEGLLCMKRSSDEASDWELKCKEQERLIEKSNHVIADLKKMLDEKRTVHDRTVTELNRAITNLKKQIKSLEQDVESERKVNVDARTRNNSNAQNIKLIRGKVTNQEREKKNSEAVTTETQEKLKTLQEQIKTKESEWNKEKEETGIKLKRQESMLQKLSVDKNEFAATLKAMEDEKLIIQEGMQKTIETLTEELRTTKRKLENVVKERNAGFGKCATSEGCVPRKDDFSAEWGTMPNNGDNAEKHAEEVVQEVQIQELKGKLPCLDEKNENVSKSTNKLIATDCTECNEITQQLARQQECINRYKTLLQDSEDKLRDKTNVVANLQKEIMELQVRQKSLEDQNNTCSTDQLQSMIEEDRQNLYELVKQSIENEQKLKHNANVIERQSQQIREMEDLLRHQEKMAAVLQASRDELVLEKKSLFRYSQEMRSVLGEVTKEEKMQDRLIKELLEKIDLRERQIIKLEKEVTELETNLMLTNEKKFKLQETVENMEKQLQHTKAYINQLTDDNQKTQWQRFWNTF
ncbi:golgin subfamily A member 6-like protein 24 [Euwallacea similis]|uniref:golgin subfamily A member 6-like protein 24 n=1 Tax=Euwallacea similis TaxID=1736056 RepID=UPI00344EB28E